MSLDEALASDRFEEILTTEVEPHLGKIRPTFLTEYPACLAALARTKPGEPQVAERFELYIDGLELANAFTELTDPREQRSRFETDERPGAPPARRLTRSRRSSSTSLRPCPKRPASPSVSTA